MIALGPRRVLGSMLLIAVVGCGGESESTPPPAPTAPAESAPAPASKDPVGASSPIVPKK